MCPQLLCLSPRCLILDESLAIVSFYNKLILAAGKGNSVNKKEERKKESFMMTMAALKNLKVHF